MAKLLDTTVCTYSPKSNQLQWRNRWFNHDVFVSYSDGGNIEVQGLAQILEPRLNSLKTTEAELRDALLAFDKSGNNSICVQGEDVNSLGPGKCGRNIKM